MNALEKSGRVKVSDTTQSKGLSNLVGGPASSKGDNVSTPLHSAHGPSSLCVIRFVRFKDDKAQSSRCV